MTEYKLLLAMRKVANFDNVRVDEKIDALNFIKEVFIKESPNNLLVDHTFTSYVKQDELEDMVRDGLLNNIDNSHLGNYLLDLVTDPPAKPSQINYKERLELWGEYDKLLNKLLVEYKTVFVVNTELAEVDPLLQPNHRLQYRSIESICNKVVNNVFFQSIKRLHGATINIAEVNNFPQHIQDRFKFVECGNHPHDRGTCNLIKKLTSLEPEHNTNQGGDHHGFN